MVKAKGALVYVQQTVGGWRTVPHRQHEGFASEGAALFPEFGKGAEVDSALALPFPILHFGSRFAARYATCAG